MNKDRIKTILKSLRESRGYSQQQVAEMLGVDRSTYVKYEAGKILPSRKLNRLAEIYEISVDFILGNPEPQPRFNLQLLSTSDNSDEPNIPQEVYSAYAYGKVLSLKNEESKKLTLQIMEDIMHLTIPQLEAVSNLIKTMK